MSNGNTLNTQQLSAINYGKGPLLIIAGAGTGKTTVITERIKHLIVDENIESSSILALTFTDKAAFEMQERLDILLPYGYTNLWIHTFHSFCDRVLRDEAHSIGLDTGYKLISQSESLLLLKKNVFDLGLKIFRPLGNPTKFLDGLLKHFSRLKDEDVSPTQYNEWALKNSDAFRHSSHSVLSSGSKDLSRIPSVKIDPGVANAPQDDEIEQYLELANAYKKYEELKIKESAMDFSDLISNTLLLFRTRPSILKRYQNQFKYIFVDEFQDTNYAQNELAILLAGSEKNITVVADDDQSIYRFRGAAVSNVLQFKDNFPDAKIITLTDNYRSTQTILDSSHELIQHNNPNRLEAVEHIDKKLKSHSKSSNKKIEFIHSAKAEDEAESIADTIFALGKDAYDYKDIAILVRANDHAQMITTALQRRGIPYQFLGPGYLFQQEEIKNLIAYLTVLTNLSDSVSLFRVLSMDIFDIPTVELNFLLNFAKKRNLTLFEALSFTDQPFLKPETQEKIKSVREMIERHLERSKKDTGGQIIYYFLIDSKLYESLQKTETLKQERQVQNIAKFFERVKNFEMERNDANIFTLVEWLNLMLQSGDSPTAAEIDSQDKNAVNILTVHSSKGLEFKVVFLINLVSDRFPSRERAEKIPLPSGIIKEKIIENIDFHLQEERRLFYVGMTRAKEILYFTASDYYGTGKRIKKLSPFIYEAIPNLKEEKEIKKSAHQLSLDDIISGYEKTLEKEENKHPLKLNYITFSNLQMFDICPLHYKAKVIFNIPTPTAAVQSYGISIHNTLYRFYRQVQDDVTPSLDDLIDILKKEWISEGYINKTHEEERYAQAIEMLREFYKTQFTPELKPLALELPFSFILKNGVKVFGKIDRVDRKDGGIEIIDYKTGEDNPKAKASHELQLAMYALAATRVRDPILNKSPEFITLTLHFLEGNTKKSMTFTKNDLEKLENELLEKIEDIENSEFACSKSVLCINCEYKMLCQV